MVVKSIQNQCRQIFDNLDIVLACFEEKDLAQPRGAFPNWKHLYHTIHSLDKNFIDPASFTEPEFHSPNLDVIYLPSNNALSKKEIDDYYLAVKARVHTYLAHLTPETLEERLTFRGLSLTRLELILAQLRHVFYHVGYLHCCLKMERGQTPEYVGLYPTVEEK